MSRSTQGNNWPVVKFGDVVENVNLVERNALDAGLDRFVGLEHMDSENLHIRRWGMIEGSDTTFTKRFRKGQVLFGKRRAYQRKVAVAEFDGICSSDILTFESKGDALIPELLPFVVRSDGFFERALGTSAGSLSPRTRWSQLADYEFPLPPRDEQRRIAEILWAADTDVRAKQDVLSTAWIARIPVIDHLIPDPAGGRNRYPVRTLADVCQMQNGRPFPSPKYQCSGIRLIRPGNLAINGTFDWSPEATTHMPDHYRNEAAEFIVQPGDIVINLTAQSLEDGFMGRVCWAGNDDVGLLNQRLGRFVCMGDLHPEYLYRCLQTTRFRHLVESRCEGSKVRHTYFRHFAEFPLVLVPFAEQCSIAEHVRMVDTAHRSAKDAFDRSRFLSNRLREHLMRPEKAVIDAIQ